MALRKEQPLLLPWNEQANGFPVQRICFGPYGSAATHAVNTFCFCGVARTMFWLWRETTTAVSAVCRHGASAATESFKAFRESYRCQPQSCSSAAKEFLIGSQGALHRQPSAPSSAVSSECWWNPFLSSAKSAANRPHLPQRGIPGKTCWLRVHARVEAHPRTMTWCHNHLNESNSYHLHRSGISSA